MTVKPFIDGEPTEKKYVIENDDISFMCDVSGIPHPIITWTKDNAVISNDDLGKFEIQRVAGMLR